jgi:hypothetical protein
LDTQRKKMCPWYVTSHRAFAHRWLVGPNQKPGLVKSVCVDFVDAKTSQITGMRVKATIKKRTEAARVRRQDDDIAGLLRPARGGGNSAVDVMQPPFADADS